MFRPLKSTLVAAGVAAVASATLASPALAAADHATPATGCANKADVAVWTQDHNAPAVCLGGAGRHEVNVAQAARLTAGDHGGVVRYRCGCVWVVKHFNAGEAITLDKGAVVTQIDIS